MPKHQKPPVMACHLWLKQRQGDGRFYMTGRLGALRVIVRPVDGAPDGSPEYTMEFAESDRPILPGQTDWIAASAGRGE
jgi:hypothetical protein